MLWIMKNVNYVVILLYTVIVSCNKSNSKMYSGLVSDFPNSIGNTLTYNVTDSIRNTTINITVSVAGRTTMDNGEPVAIWTYSSSYGIDTSYVLTNKDSVVFYGNRSTNVSKISIRDIYRFPMTVGARWRVSFSGDTTTVISKNSISVNSVTYNNVFLLHEHGRSHNYTISKNQWFVPKIGLIKMDYITLGVNQHWELTSYHIK